MIVIVVKKRILNILKKLNNSVVILLALLYLFEFFFWANWIIFSMNSKALYIENKKNETIRTYLFLYLSFLLKKLWPSKL